MKQINNTKSEVYLSTYDESDLLLPVSEEYKGIENICVAVKFGDTLIKISPKDTCECSWYDAMRENREKLTHPTYWQMVGSVYYEANQALKMLGHDPLRWVWTDTEDNNPPLSSYSALYYFGNSGSIDAYSKLNSLSVREAKVFKINE